MEEISQLAKAYYQASSTNIQSLARDFFNAMDNDSDGKIDIHEFIEFMEEGGHGQLTDPLIFNKLDRDGNGTLDFFEVMTVYYIIKSGKPFCYYCKQFIASTYLTCLGCLEDPNGSKSIYLCLGCYSRQVCDHTHNDMSCFLDNYSLLEAMKLKTSVPRASSSRSRPMDTNSVSVQVPQQPPAIHHHHNTYIQKNLYYNNTQTYNVPQQPQLSKMQIAAEALDMAIKAGTAVTTCSIL